MTESFLLSLFISYLCSFLAVFLHCFYFSPTTFQHLNWQCLIQYSGPWGLTSVIISCWLQPKDSTLNKNLWQFPQQSHRICTKKKISLNLQPQDNLLYLKRIMIKCGMCLTHLMYLESLYYQGSYLDLDWGSSCLKKRFLGEIPKIPMTGQNSRLCSLLFSCYLLSFYRAFSLLF